MARFSPLRWLGQAVRRVFQPEPSPVRSVPPTRMPPAGPVRPTQPRERHVTRFYTRDVPTELARDHTVNELMSAAWFDPSASPDFRIEMRAALRDYVEDEYDLRWDDYFDWEAWREEMGY